MISRSNYEIVFIDYFDGKLDKNREEELFAFLKFNPDLQEEFNLFSGTQTEPDFAIRFGAKEKLKKETITNYNYKTWLVGYIENDLSNEQKKEVDSFLSKNSSFKPELEIFKLARLVPDSRIIFNKKNELKRSAKIIYFTPAIKRVLSVAAVLIFLAVAYFVIHQLNIPKSVVADHEEKEQDINETNNVPDYKKSIEENKNESRLISPVKKATEFSKSNVLATNTKIPVEPAKINPLKEIQNTVTPENLYLIQLKDSLNIADNSVNNTPSESEKLSPSKYLQPPSSKLSEIFNNEDMNELGILNADSENSKSNMSLGDLAAGEIKKISKATDISYEKQKNPLNNSVTYALEVGKSFSISHTVVQ